MIAGDWLSDRDAVEKVVRNAPQQIKELISWGVDFDKDEKGNFDLHREGDIPNSASCTIKTIQVPKYRIA